MNELRVIHVVDLLRAVLIASRVEKVVRVALGALRNLLKYKMLCEDIAEKGTLEVVQQPEFEKWRDAELYEEIKDLSVAISTEISKLSSFDRYERELATKKLRWGFIHSDKFWQENVLKFEKDGFTAIKDLRDILLYEKDVNTLAVACH